MHIVLIVLIMYGIFDLSQSSLSPPFYRSNQIKFDDLDPTETILQSQSDTCSYTDNIQRIQCFRELPLPQYEVFEGQDVMLKCRVAFQRGKVQWAFKGKMFGFDRDIPNYPRLRMPGNYDIGDHSLFIENVRVSDSGNYECQLSPSASQPPRRRMTELLVLKPPMNPVIYRDKILVTRSILVSIRRDDANFIVNLTCVASDGNPNPTFLWSVNDSRILSPSIFRLVKTQITKVNESSSVLSLRSDQIVNNDVISCGVFNKATEKRAEFTDRTIVTRIHVFKRILPGPLQFKEILAKTNTIIIKENEQLKLSCLTKDPGDPPIKLGWTSTLYNYPIRDEMIRSSYNRTISHSTLIIPEVESCWHRKSLTCSGTQDGLPATKSISKTILVKHLPRELDIAVMSLATNNTIVDRKIIYCTETQLVRFICSTSTFYLQNVQISWFAKTTEESDWKSVIRSSENMVNMDGGRLRLLKSMVEISPNQFYKNTPKQNNQKFLLKLLSVFKSPDSGGELRKAVEIQAYVPSKSPIIMINDERNSSILINGQSVTIKCSVTGGIPPPELHLVDDSDHEISTQSYNTKNSTIIQYSMELKQEDNGKRFRCLTSSKITLDYMSLSSNLITLTIAIRPQQLIMDVSEPNVGNRAQQNVSFRCTTDSSIPTATIEWWWYHNCKPLHTNMLTIHSPSSSILRSHCQVEILKNGFTSRYDSSTLSTTSTITILLLPSSDLTFIECLIAPYHKWPILIRQLSKIHQISVQYLPRFFQPLWTVYTVEEGQNISVAINATSNPAINGYTWLKNNQAIIRKSRIKLKVDNFSVSHARPDMMGNYTLILENQLGKSAISFFLNVTFAPKLLGPSNETIKVNPKKEYRQRAVIMCSAQANPFREQTNVQWTRTPQMVMDHIDLVYALHNNDLFSTSPHVHCAKDHWSRGNISINCISLGAIEVVSSLQVTPMDYRYIGSYQCMFSSNIKSSSRAMKTTHLVVPTLPVPLINHRKSEYAVKQGGITEIICYFIAFPTPSIAWTRFDHLRCSENSAKYSVYVYNLQIGLHKAVLAIKDTNESDVGTYICTAQNRYGTSNNSVLLIQPAAPRQPMNVTITNTTDSSITIGWLLGFNGGSKQTIMLRWRLHDIGQNAGYNIIELEEIENSDLQFYTINGLRNDHEYEILIEASNEHTVHPVKPTHMSVKTMRFESGGRNVQEKNEMSNIFIIILLSTLGGLLLGIKIGLIAYCIKRRDSRHHIALSKISSPIINRTPNDYFFDSNIMEMRASSSIKHGVESNMYVQSISDHLSQNGSDKDQKFNYYKTIPDDVRDVLLLLNCLL